MRPTQEKIILKDKDKKRLKERIAMCIDYDLEFLHRRFGTWRAVLKFNEKRYEQTEAKIRDVLNG